MLAECEVVTTNARKSPKALGKLVNQGHHAARTASLYQLLETARPPGPDGPIEGRETKAFAKARYMILQGEGATAWLRARPTDSLSVIPSAEFVGIGRRFMGKRHVVVRCPCCDAADVNT